jgi:hypothetical protein
MNTLFIQFLTYQANAYTDGNNTYVCIRRGTTSRNVAGSVPHEVIDFN